MMNTLKKLVKAYFAVVAVVYALYAVVAVVCLCSKTARSKVETFVTRWTLKCMEIYNKLYTMIKYHMTPKQYEKTKQEAEDTFNKNLADIIRKHEEEYGTVKLDDFIEE